MPVEAGIRFPWLGTHAGIPAGFTRATDLDDRYPLGAAPSTGGANGGSSTHAHTAAHVTTHAIASHTHAGTASGSGGAATGSATAGVTVAAGAHTHVMPTTGAQTAVLGAGNVATTTTGSSLPASSEVIWIQTSATIAGLPNAAYAFWAGATVPAGWVAEAGPAGKYLVGATTGASAGGTRGSASHSHTGQAHTHAFGSHVHAGGNTGLPSATTSVASTAVVSLASATHTHTATVNVAAIEAASGSATSGATGTADVAPLGRKLAIIRNNTGAAALVIGVIGIWNGGADLPVAWIACDGTRGTPDMRGYLVVAGAADLSDVLAVVGTGGHGHSAAAGHTHSAAHTHLFDTTLGPNASATRTGGGATGTSIVHTHTGLASGSGGGTTDSIVENITSLDALPPYRTQVFVQFRPDALPAIPLADTEASASQVADALSGRFGGVDLRFRYTRRSRTNEFIDDVSAAVITPGKITLDNTRGVLRDLTMTLDRSLAPADFEPSRDIIGVEAEVYVAPVGQWVAMPLGLYTLDVSETHYRGRSVTIPVKGADLVMLLMRSISTAPYRVAGGTAYETAVEAVLDAHGLAHVIPVTGKSLPFSVTWPPGTTYWQIVRDLMWGVNYYPPYADVQGVIRTEPRLDPSSIAAAVAYQDTVEPKMISDPDEYVTRVDRKLANRVSLSVEVRLAVVQVEAENADPDAPNSTAALAYGTPADILSSSAGNPAVVETTTPHGLGTGVPVLIRDHLGAVLDINGTHEATVVSATTFTVPIAVTVGGSGGTVQPTTIQLVDFKPDGDPSTRAVADVAITAPAIAHYELRWAAVQAQQASLSTFLDPRRGEHENYDLDIVGIEETQLYAVIGWALDLAPGSYMQHTIGRANAIDVINVAPWGV